MTRPGSWTLVPPVQIGALRCATLDFHDVGRTFAITTEKASMKSHWITSGALVSAILLAPVHTLQAGTEITCLFSWEENAEANIKAHSQRAATLKKVRTKEYEKLVGKKVAAKVKGAGGDQCTLKHPDNGSIKIAVRKDAFRLDPKGAMPDCNVLMATVICEGMESPESKKEGSSEN